MNATHVSPSPVAIRACAAAAAVLLSIAIIAGIGALFSRDGAPLEATVTAEHACSEYRFASERAQCMTSFVWAAQRPAIAGR